MCYNCNNNILAHYAQFNWHNNVGKQNFILPHVRKLRLNIKNKKCSILCSKCPHAAATQALSLFRHCPIALSITDWCCLSHCPQFAVWGHWRLWPVSCKLVLKVFPRSCSPLGLNRDYLVATNLVGWSLESQLSGVRQSHKPDAPGLHPAET